MLWKLIPLLQAQELEDQVDTPVVRQRQGQDWVYELESPQRGGCEGTLREDTEATYYKPPRSRCLWLR